MTNALFLRRVFAIDALTCAVCAVAMTLAAVSLAPLTGLDAGFVRTAGLLLVPCAALFGWLASRERPPLAIAVVAILGNLLWVAESLMVMATRAGELTALGQGLIGAQAAAVLMLAAAESYGVALMRRAAA